MRESSFTHTGQTRRLPVEEILDQLREEYLNHPIVRAGLVHYRHGDLTIDEALINTIKWLVRANEDLMQRLTHAAAVATRIER